MIDWLKQKEQQQNSLFQELITNSINILKKVNKEGETNFLLRINFEKDKWLEGKAKVEIIQEKNNEYDVKYTYNHYVYNKKEDVKKQFILKLMEEGMLTNSWFSVLDSSRIYDTEILLNNNGYTLENENCEHLENRTRLRNLKPTLDEIKKNKP